MKIQYMSDLHLEYIENRQYFRDNPVEPVGDILILAGDIVQDNLRNEASDFFEDIQSKFSFIISTMGNHEFYNGEISHAFPSYEKLLADNHILLNNKSIVIEDIKFIVSTLWTQVNPIHEAEIFRRLNDYRYIKKEIDGKLTDLTVADTNYYHQISKEFISQELQKDFSGKIVVVTHHLPSINCVLPKWRNVNVLSAFANDNMDNLILDNKIAGWIFGHQHEQINDYIGNTKILSNPLGYSKEENFHLFDAKKFIEL